jgi:hypothetical protein
MHPGIHTKFSSDILKCPNMIWVRMSHEYRLDRNIIYPFDKRDPFRSRINEDTRLGVLIHDEVTIRLVCTDGFHPEV